MIEPAAVKRIAVLGAGTIGGSWVAWFLARGMQVTVWGPRTMRCCLDFYRHIGKRPIHIRKEAPGHLANRLQAALWREAVRAVVTGPASVEDVDTAISAGPGLRGAVMGPHMTFHLGGGEGGITHMLDQFT